ncbi:LysR family transcriptional regulator [Treponema zioleckii]|uniref:LysR family transcriptional regulator n=1 Tax=Treponema zioleckii TaxID=331680 RepID=UPI00168A52AF|nr:LysR family transcriptional regulator [Treponema zioleckii]
MMKNFLKVAEKENITQSSKELNVAQPHLTRQIQNLEEELGVKLFVREKKRLHITDEGRFLKQQVEQILKLVEKTERQIREMSTEISGTLFIGVIESVSANYLPEWINKFKKNHSAVKYNIWSANSNDVTERLEKGLVDIAIVREPVDSEKFSSIHLLDENWAAFFSKNHIFSQKTGEKISLAELSNVELLVPAQRVEEIEGWFLENKLFAKIICAFSPMNNGLELVKQDFGVAILPESAVKSVNPSEVLVKKLAEEKNTGIAVIWKKDYELPVVAKNFINILKSDFIQ